MTSILGAAASGLQHHARIMDTTGHNLANVNTDGFKSVRALGEGRPSAEVTPDNARLGVATTSLDRNFSQGSVRNTQDPLHFAIQDGSFFRVQGDGGTERFTRQGALSMDAEGNVLAQGGRRLDPPMQLPEGATSPEMQPDGTVTALDADGEQIEVGRLPMVQFTNPRGLESVGDGLYRQTVNSGDVAEGFPGEEPFASLSPRGVESSNVDLSTEFTNMITAQRAYQANSRSFSIGDEMLALATDITA